MDTTSAHMLTVLGQLRDTQVRQDGMLEMILRNQREIARRQAAILKAVGKPPLTIKRLWDNYIKPISAIVAWIPAGWLGQHILAGGTIKSALAQLSAFF